jgi:hypothetical protein
MSANIDGAGLFTDGSKKPDGRSQTDRTGVSDKLSLTSARLGDAMTVRDFIAILSRLDPHAEVLIKEAARGFSRRPRWDIEVAEIVRKGKAVAVVWL